MDNSISRRDSSFIKTILLLSAFFATLNETAVNVVLSDLMEAFGVPISTIQWLVTAFMLVMAVVVTTTAFIIRSFRTRPIYFASIALIAIGSALAGLAVGFPMVLAGRMLQAAGTSCLIALLVNTLLALTPPKERGTAMGLFALVTSFAPAIAPTLAGFILQLWGWRSIFLALLPVFLILSVLAARMLRDISVPAAGKGFDAVSVMLAVVAFGGLLYGISVAETAAENPAGTILPAAVGAAALALFIVRQLRIDQPLLDLRVFRYPMFGIAAVHLSFSLMLIFGVLILTPMFLEKIIGLSSAMIGLAMLPGGILNGLTAPVFGKIYDRCGPRLLIRIGSAILVASAVIMAFLPIRTAAGAYIAVHCLLIVGISLVITVSQTNGFNQLPRQMHPHGTAITSTLMQLFGGIGSAVFAVSCSIGEKGFLGAHSDAGRIMDGEAFLAGFHSAFRIAAGLMLIPLVLSFFVSKSEAPAEKFSG